MQLTAGLLRLRHDVRYYEVTSRWPYDPRVQCKVGDSGYAIGYLERIMPRFGLDRRWAYRRTYSDRAWLGPAASDAASFLESADLVFNVAGATSFAAGNIATGPRVYYGTDPVFHEIGYANHDPIITPLIDEHAMTVTFGENIGQPDCAIPPLPRLRAHTRQPVLLDQWPQSTAGSAFTTVGNWKQDGRDVVIDGEIYRWSKHHEFGKFLDLPQRTSQPLELATNLMPSSAIVHRDRDEVTATGFDEGEYERLVRLGWRVVDGPALSLDPEPYRQYILGSRGEFTVARDLNVRLRSGWFSERSACYLAAGKPVITQNTGFDRVLPVGAGLFAVQTVDEAAAAIDAINSDYARHSARAREIAEEFFRAETVLSKLLDAL